MADSQILQKMANLDYHYAVAQMKAAEGGRLDKIYEIEDGLFRFRVGKQGEKFEIMARLGQAFALSSFIPESPQQPTPFASLLRKHLDNATVLSIEQVSFDRLVLMKLQKESQYLLYFEMFAKGNIALCSADGKVMAAWEEQKEGKRIVCRGREYPVPGLRGAEPFDEKAVRELLEAGAEPAKAIALSPAYLQDCLANTAGKGPAAVAADAKKYASNAQPTVYYGEKGAIGFSSVRLNSPQAFLKAVPTAQREFETLSDALDEYQANAYAGQKQAKAPKNKALEKLVRQRDLQQKAVDESLAEAEKLRAAGDAIYLNYDKATAAIADAAKKGKKTAEIEA